MSKHSEKKKILDVKIPIKEQEKLLPFLKDKKYMVCFEEYNGKVRYAYGDDPIVLEMGITSIRGKILKITKIK